MGNRAKPKLRSVKTEPASQGGQPGILLSDPLGISRRTLFIPGSSAVLLTLLDGTRDAATLRAGFELRTGGYLDIATLEGFISSLDEALYLETERFDELYRQTLDGYRSAPSRPPIMAGLCYPPSRDELAAFLFR